MRQMMMKVMAGSIINAAVTVPMAHARLATDAPDMIDTQILFAELQFSPNLLAASGMNASEANAVLSATYTEISDLWASYSLIRTQLDMAVSQAGTIRQQLRSLPADDTSRSQLQADLGLLEIQIGSLQQDKASYLSAFDLAASDAMSSDDRSRFNRMRENADRSTPIAYRALDLNDEEWTELHHALAVIKTNEEPSSEYTQIVNSHEASYDFNLAEGHLQTNLASVTTTLTDFLLSLDQ